MKRQFLFHICITVLLLAGPWLAGPALAGSDEQVEIQNPNEDKSLVYTEVGENEKDNHFSTFDCFSFQNTCIESTA